MKKCKKLDYPFLMNIQWVMLWFLVGVQLKISPNLYLLMVFVRLLLIFLLIKVFSLNLIFINLRAFILLIQEITYRVFFKFFFSSNYLNFSFRMCSSFYSSHRRNFRSTREQRLCWPSNRGSFCLFLR